MMTVGMSSWRLFVKWLAPALGNVVVIQVTDVSVTEVLQVVGSAYSEQTFIYKEAQGKFPEA